MPVAMPLLGLSAGRRIVVGVAVSATVVAFVAVLVGGGDPVVTRAGPHSIDFLAEVVAKTGLKGVNGRILVDESRYDTVRTGPNWPADWLYSIGPMSALGVEHNMFTKDRAYVDDPAKGNGEVLKFALVSRGIAVSGGWIRVG